MKMEGKVEVGIFELMYCSESNNNTEEILFIFVVGIRLDSNTVVQFSW